MCASGSPAVRDTFSHSRRHVERARRYRLRLGLEYDDGTRAWRYGQTRDVSASGVLFEVLSEESRALRVNAPIEMTLMLPADIVGEVLSRVVCAGRIIRIVKARPSGRTHVAATIDLLPLERMDLPIALESLAGAQSHPAPRRSSIDE